MMFRIGVIGIGLLALGVAVPAAAQPPAPKAKGIESEGYVWNEMMGEKLEALDLPPNSENGEEAYEICSACHLPSGAGRPDGTFPQLAGQHRTVVIKQIADIREGRRDNPIMYPFAKTLTDSQELSDVSAYIQTLPIPHDNGKGAGTDLERGKQLYQDNCVKCHGAFGEGDNANPDMVKIVVDFSDEDLQAVVDYMSRLEWPERQAKP
jgi:cytochrome c553